MLAMQIEMLQRMPIFGAIRGESLSFLLDRAAHRRIVAGQPFFREGDPGDRMFVLESGRAAVVKGWQGSEVLLHDLEPGKLRLPALPPQPPGLLLMLRRQLRQVQLRQSHP